MTLVNLMRVPNPAFADSMLGMRQIRESLSEKKAEIKRVKIFIDDENFPVPLYTIEEIFDLVRGNGKYTKSYVQIIRGSIHYIQEILLVYLLRLIRLILTVPAYHGLLMDWQAL